MPIHPGMVEDLAAGTRDLYARDPVLVDRVSFVCLLLCSLRDHAPRDLRR
ncbi:hypothetical protein [Streptomyces sp. NPDC056817]